MVAQIMSMTTNWATRAATVSMVCGVLRAAVIRTVSESSAAADLGTLVSMIVEILRRWGSFLSQAVCYKDLNESKATPNRAVCCKI
jgi:hypothetical protein